MVIVVHLEVLFSVLVELVQVVFALSILAEADSLSRKTNQRLGQTIQRKLVVVFVQW